MTTWPLSAKLIACLTNNARSAPTMGRRPGSGSADDVDVHGGCTQGAVYAEEKRNKVLGTAGGRDAAEIQLVSGFHAVTTIGRAASHGEPIETKESQ